MDVDDTGLLMILSDQRNELTAAGAGDSDLDIAFQLQMQEAINASLTSKPCSSSSEDEGFRVYFKGLVIDKTVMNVKMSFGGIGVAICDSSDSCIFESRRSFLLDAGGRGTEGDVVDLKALIEALNTAASLELKRVHIFCDSNSIHQYLTGKVQATNNRIVTMVDQLNLIQRQFSYCSPFLVSQNHVKFAYKLAKDAISSEATKWAGSDSSVTIVEKCIICFECNDSGQMFSVNKCQHRYCFSCVRKHIEAQVLQGKLPGCPHEKCKSTIEIESCKKFLNSELYDIMSLRIKEASIPPSEKVYCPFSNCSALMSKTEVQEYTPTSSSTSAQVATGMRKCVKCNLLFCINCKVQWHDNITCSNFMKSVLFRSSNEAKLQSLATKNRWRECIKCKNMIELATGCNHIYCRCGYEFCYTCGAEWIKKKPTCRCQLWDERNIIYNQNRR